MADALAEKLATYGIDLVDAEDRFDGNLDLYKRMALKYLQDDHLVSLVAAMDVKDYDEAFKQAHALKGVAGNLSFVPLYKAVAIVSDALKAGEAFGAEQNLPAAKAAHEKVLEGLELWSQE